MSKTLRLRGPLPEMNFRCITMACSDELLARITALAKRDKVSRSLTMRQLIEAALPLYETPHKRGK